MKSNLGTQIGLYKIGIQDSTYDVSVNLRKIIRSYIDTAHESDDLIAYYQEGIDTLKLLDGIENERLQKTKDSLIRLLERYKHIQEEMNTININTFLSAIKN